ncbi:hypothetical protein AWB74_05777 [Caballeronia arvi]|uniref:Uncharacterized protein n=1 Tax=Caballeronia arvi TaxID=1777135 RepID=A0A158KJK8_9BURK|nr:hypothetical protein [Caballeronia arvi]SAL80740.1 hypothetical protein AWB74_05777 [Caballeronia arvi]
MNIDDKESESSYRSLERLFPESMMVHTMHVLCLAQFLVLSRMLSCLAGYDHTLKSLQGTRDGEMLHQRIVLIGISEREAKSIKLRLSQCEGVVRVQIEHLIRRVQAD